MAYFWGCAGVIGTDGAMVGTAAGWLGTMGMLESAGTGLTFAAASPVLFCCAPLVGIGAGVWMGILRKRKRRKAGMEQAEREVGDRAWYEDGDTGAFNS